MFRIRFNRGFLVQRTLFCFVFIIPFSSCSHKVSDVALPISSPSHNDNGVVLPNDNLTKNLDLPPQENLQCKENQYMALDGRGCLDSYPIPVLDRSILDDLISGKRTVCIYIPPSLKGPQVIELKKNVRDSINQWISPLVELNFFNFKPSEISFIELSAASKDPCPNQLMHVNVDASGEPRRENPQGSQIPGYSDYAYPPLAMISITEKSSPGTITHEIGHLFGFPDIYLTHEEYYLNTNPANQEWKKKAVYIRQGFLPTIMSANMGVVSKGDVNAIRRQFCLRNPETIGCLNYLPKNLAELLLTENFLNPSNNQDAPILCKFEVKNKKPSVMIAWLDSLGLTLDKQALGVISDMTFVFSVSASTYFDRLSPGYSYNPSLKISYLENISTFESKEEKKRVELLHHDLTGLIDYSENSHPMDTIELELKNNFEIDFRSNDRNFDHWFVSFSTTDGKLRLASTDLTPGTSYKFKATNYILSSLIDEKFGCKMPPFLERIYTQLSK